MPIFTDRGATSEYAIDAECGQFCEPLFGAVTSSRAAICELGRRELAYPCVNPSLTLPMQQSAPAWSPSLPLRCSASAAALSEDIIGDSTEKMDTVVAELVSFFQALKSGSLFGYLILLAFVLTGFPLIIVAVAYQCIAIKRFQTTSKATQENFETIAADLRKRALEIKKQDEGLRKRDLEVKERDELKGFVKNANAELRREPQRPQQQRQVLKGSQRAMKGSVSHIITVGLKDFQNRILQTDFKVMTSVVPDSSKADLHTRLACGQGPRSSPRRIHDPLVTSIVGATRRGESNTADCRVPHRA